ncbi:MAG: ArnT family glycosyltransferase [Desulfitobacteriaceae bacterium]
MDKIVKQGILGVIFLGALALRLRGIWNPLLDDQAWRQADTASIGFNMLGHLTAFPDVFFPRLMYDGVLPQKVELEFPFLPYLLAWTGSLFGWTDLWGRLWSILFSLLGLWGLYDLTRHLVSKRAAFLTAGFYAIVPITVYYGRAVMPEPVAQAFSLWALALLRRWHLREKKGVPFFEAVLMAGAILAKLPQLMLLPVALSLGFWPLRRSKIAGLVGYLIVTLFLPVLYYGWVHFGASGSGRFVSGIVSQQVAAGNVFYSTELLNNLRQGFNTGLLALAGVGGVLVTIRRTDASRPLLLWLGISVLYVGLICVRIPLDYYLVPVVPVVCLLAALALGVIEDIPGNVLAVVVLCLLCFTSYSVLTPKYVWNKTYLEQAGWLREHLKRGQVILLSDAQPMTFYYARSTGFRLPAGQAEELVREVENSHASYFVALPESKQQPEFYREISRRYPLVGPGIYRLK